MANESDAAFWNGFFIAFLSVAVIILIAILYQTIINHADGIECRAMYNVKL